MEQKCVFSYSVFHVGGREKKEERGKGNVKTNLANEKHAGPEGGTIEEGEPYHRRNLREKKKGNRNEKEGGRKKNLLSEAVLSQLKKEGKKTRELYFVRSLYGRNTVGL